MPIKSLYYGKFKKLPIERYNFLKSETIYPFDNSIDLKNSSHFLSKIPKTKNRTTLFYFMLSLKEEVFLRCCGVS